MTDPIVETMDFPEGEFSEDMAATAESQPTEKLEFHVQMRGYTLREMDSLIVEAAARIIVGRSGDNRLAKEIETRCVELTAKRADIALSKVTAEIVDQPMLPAFRGATNPTPVTMREYLGLVGREYLTTPVGIHSGEVGSNSYSGRVPRMEFLVRRMMQDKFKTEIEKASNAAVAEIQAEVRAQYAKLLDVERARVKAALEKAALS